MTTFEEDLAVTNSDEFDTPNGSRGKRRSKRDVQGRTFKCGCEKMYLSYPALYTHIKTKHDGIAPPGTETPLAVNTRGRGRPRKGAMSGETREESKNFHEENPLDELGIFGGSTDPSSGFEDVNSDLLKKVNE